MGLSLFLNSLLEFYLSFCTECSYNNCNIIYIFVLWLVLLLFIFFMGIPSIPTFWKNEHTHKGRVKRRRKGGTGSGSTYYQSDGEEQRELIAFLKSPLGWNHDSIHLRQLLCPDPSCDTCNNATAEINQLFSKALEISTPSVSPVVSTAPVTALVTEPSFQHSSAIPEVPLTEPSHPPHSVLPLNSMTTLGNSLSLSPSYQTLALENSLHAESEFPVQKPRPQPKDLFSSTLTQYDFHQKLPDILSTKTSSVEESAAKHTEPTQLFFLSPDEHGSVEQHSYPKAWEDNLKQEVIQLFWGLPSLHSESLLSAVHVSSDYSIFNSISNAFTSQECTALPYFLPPSLPKVQPQLLPQNLPLCHHLPVTQLQPQVHLQSPLPILPSGSIYQSQVCGVYCQTPWNESESFISSDAAQLEWNVLKKKQKSLEGLPSLVQSPWEAPTSPYHRLSKDHSSIPIDHFEFPLSIEFRKKFEHHLKKRLIQHRWGLLRRIHESLSLMKPRCDYTDIPQPKFNYGLSWISQYKAQDSKILNRVTPSASFYKKGSEMFQLSEDETDSLASYPQGLLSDSDHDSDKDLENDYDMKSVSKKQLANFLQVHLAKKFEEISESQLRGTLQSSKHSIQHTLSVESNREIKQRSLPSSEGGNYCLNKSLSFLEAGAPEMLENHGTYLPMKTLAGLSAKVLESTKDFKLKGTTPHSLINPDTSSSTKVISEVITESGAFTLLKGSSESLHSDPVRTENLAPHLNLHLPATLLLDKEGHGIEQEHPEDIQTILEAKPLPLPVTNTIPGKTSQSHSLIGNIQPSELPARQANKESSSKNKSVNSADRTEMQEATNRGKAVPSSMPTMPREIARAEELHALQSVPISKTGISQNINRDITVTTENPPPKISDQAPKLSDLRKQLIVEMNLKLESRKYSETQGQPLDRGHDSDSLTYKAPLTPAKCVSFVDKEVHQVLHVHSEDSTVRMEKEQDPWLPRHALSSCQDQNFPPAIKKDIVLPPPTPTGPKYEELGAGDARVINSQPGGKRFSPQDTALEDMRGSKSFHSLSQKGQAPPDSLFLNKMKSLFQRLRPAIKWTMQETTQEMGRHISSAQSSGPVKSRGAFTGSVQVHRVMSDIGKFPEENLGRGHARVTTCPQEPFPSAAQSGKPVQKGAVKTRAKPVQTHPLNCRAPFYNMTNMKSGLQATISGDQRSTSIRHTRNEDSSRSKPVALKGQQVCQKHHLTGCIKMMVAHPSPTCRPKAAQGPPAVLTIAGSTAFKNRSPHFRHTMLLYNFQGETFPAPK